MSYKLYDAEIEHLESTGTQYIDTGVNADSNLGFDITYAFTDFSEPNYVRFGAIKQTGTSTYARHHTSVQSGVRLRNCYMFGDYTMVIHSNTDKHNLILDSTNQKFVYDGTETSFTSTDFDCNLNYFLFGRNEYLNNISTINFAKIKIYQCRLYSSGVLVRNFIPVRVGNVGYLFDKVSMKLFGNSGTGSFVLGSDVAPAAYANEVAFLESTGSQYIDTGYIPNSNTVIEASVAGLEVNCVPFGVRWTGTPTYDTLGLYFASVSPNMVVYWGNYQNNEVTRVDKHLQKKVGVKIGLTQIDIDGNQYPITRGSISNTYSLYLFGMNNMGEANKLLSSRIYNLKIIENNTTLFDFIPVEYNNIGYLYDKVSGEFFANQGTGKFVLGHRAPRFDGKACARSYTRRQLMAKAPLPLERQYLTFKVLSEGTITAVSVGSGVNRTIQYSLNGGKWQSLTISATSQSLGTFNIDDEIRIKGNNGNYSTWLAAYCHFGGTAQTEVKGNIMSLVYGDNFAGKTVLTADFTFNGLFLGWTNLVSAEDLIMPAMTLRNRCYINLFKNCSSLQKTPKVLPATNLLTYCYDEMFSGCRKIVYPPIISAVNLNGDNCCRSMFYNCTALREAPDLNATKLSPSCYSSMFQNCTSLVKAPQLLATVLANGCYVSMFQSCTSLTKAPELPATILADSCYKYMFNGCSNLTTAPSVLPATTLINGCYQYMFNGCRRINYIKAMFTTTPSTTYTNNWVNAVASSGTFVKNSAATWDVRGTHGIPNNWTIETADE